MLFASSFTIAFLSWFSFIKTPCSPLTKVFPQIKSFNGFLFGNICSFLPIFFKNSKSFLIPSKWKSIIFILAKAIGCLWLSINTIYEKVISEWFFSKEVKNLGLK